MDVKDLKDYLSVLPERSDGLEVVIPVRFPTPSLGGQSVVSVRSVNRGIDWDMSRFFINPDRQLYASRDTTPKSIEDIRALRPPQLTEELRKIGNLYERERHPIDVGLFWRAVDLTVKYMQKEVKS